MTLCLLATTTCVAVWVVFPTLHKSQFPPQQQHMYLGQQTSTVIIDRTGTQGAFRATAWPTDPVPAEGTLTMKKATLLALGLGLALVAEHAAPCL